MPDFLKEDETKTAAEIAIPVKEDYLKEDETINRNLAKTLETDANDVDSTVYSKRVAVVNLQEFIRNKGIESIFADFQVRILELGKSGTHVLLTCSAKVIHAFAEKNIYFLCFMFGVVQFLYVLILTLLCAQFI